MSDVLADGRPNEIAAELQARQLEVDRHGLQGSVMKYRLEIMRWTENIKRHEETIRITEERIEELAKQIAELGDQ